MTAPIRTPKLAAQILRSLANDLDNYDALTEHGKLDPQARLVAVVETLHHGIDAEHSAEDIKFLESLGVPADAIAPAID